MTPPAADHDPASVRRTVHYTGRVQGVGFRYTTCEVAARFDVTGTVKNLSDGRVKLVVEGPADEVTRFLEGMTRAMGGYIRDTQVAESPATGTFRDFDIAY